MTQKASLSKTSYNTIFQASMSRRVIGVVIVFEEVGSDDGVLGSFESRVLKAIRDYLDVSRTHFRSWGVGGIREAPGHGESLPWKAPSVPSGRNLRREHCSHRRRVRLPSKDVCGGRCCEPTGHE